MSEEGKVTPDKPSEEPSEGGETAIPSEGGETAIPSEEGETDRPSQEDEDKEAREAARRKALLEPVSMLEEKVIRQIEFYFGDRNLPKDKFLQQAVANNDGGWVPLDTLLTFNRLKALSSDKNYIVTALLKAKSKIAQVHEDGERIRRNPDLPLPDIFAMETRQVIKDKTVYLKGFSEDTQLDEVQEFIDSYGKTSYIQMRRDRQTKLFKGSVFVEFTEKSAAEKFLSLDEIKFKDVELLKESKEAYFKRKQEEKKVKKRTISEASVDNGDAKDESSKSEPFPIKGRAPGCILHFSGCGLDATWESIKEVVAEFSTPKFVEFTKDRTEGFVRFTEEGGAKKAMDGLVALAGDGKPQLCGGDTELRVLEGEEEQQYWRNAVKEMNKAKKSQKRTYDRGFHGRKRKQKSSEGHGEAPAPKVIKSDKEGQNQSAAKPED